ncbi:MAG: 2-oxoacid:acceptor oxidoreductase subunit alpha [Arenicellales bacterium]|jgi:2-oxoglutarate ferredoxin oxidoreductase subunit alpha|nr:2-oxoacid:acceptor oxidoreductase subunit alpha [Arenicellales bacterium]
MTNSAQHRIRNLQGNHACALAAVAAGCRFYAGYPITPSSEVAERMAAELPRVGGTFIQMEDEIASMGAVLGASIGGIKAMTATSGPGFSLKQENLGYAMGAEIPCVVINVMRGGPSTGMPTRPAQGDVMQARWGSHGDTVVIALVPASVAEIYSQTVRAFNLSEQLRVPVIVLIDEIIGHLVETVEIPASDTLVVTGRKWASGPAEDFKPYAINGSDIPAMPRPGAGYRTHITGLTHAEDGFPTQDPAVVARVMTRLLGKLDHHRDLIDCYETVACDDAEILIVAYGITARSAHRAVHQARAQGLAAGLFRPVTLWPFPEQALRSVTRCAQAVLVPEMNGGQLCWEVDRICAGTPVSRLNRIDGESITPDQIQQRIIELAEHAEH